MIIDKKSLFRESIIWSSVLYVNRKLPRNIAGELPHKNGVNIRGAWQVFPSWRRPARARSLTSPKIGSAIRSHDVSTLCLQQGCNVHAMARALGAANINVNDILPVIRRPASLEQKNCNGRFKLAKGDQIFHRRRTPEDLLGAAVFLASKGPDFITDKVLR